MKLRLEEYEKNNLMINGTFDDVISAAFAKDKEPLPKDININQDEKNNNQSKQ